MKADAWFIPSLIFVRYTYSATVSNFTVISTYVQPPIFHFPVIAVSPLVLSQFTIVGALPLPSFLIVFLKFVYSIVSASDFNDKRRQTLKPDLVR